MTEEEQRKPPVYTGVNKHVYEEAGYAVWISKDWRKINLKDERQGWIFTPYRDNFDTHSPPRESPWITR